MPLSMGIGVGIDRAAAPAASSGGGVPFAADLLVRLDASTLGSLHQHADGTGAVTADGDFVGRIDDLSGAGNHATQALESSPEKRLHYVAADAAVTTFSNTGWLEIPLTLLDYTAIIVVSSPPNFGHFYTFLDGSDAVIDRFEREAYAGKLTVSRGTQQVLSVAGLVSLGSPSPFDVYVVTVDTGAATGATLRLDRDAVSDSIGTTLGSTPQTGTFCLGRLASADVFKGFLLYGRALDDTERAEAVAYLASLYSL